MRKKWRFITLLLVVNVWCGGDYGNAAKAELAAAGLQLSLPVVCQMGTLCTIQNYVDLDPGPGAKDYTCGRLVYNGHKGTDFRLPDSSWLDLNIPVVAAALGQVVGIRNNVRDHLPGKYEPERIKGRECGNGVLIDHGEGWRTQYCHMRRGSIRVRKGEKVTSRRRLGTMGLSGKTEFPHLHFSVTFQGKVVDPFVGKNVQGVCGIEGKPLWNSDAMAELPYQPSGILSMGFTDEVPTQNQVVSGDHRHIRIGRNAPNLVFWVMIYGMQPKDEEILQVTDPNGRVLLRKKANPATNHKARWFTYSGKRARNPWARGTYEGKYQLLRLVGGEKKVFLDKTTRVKIE